MKFATPLCFLIVFLLALFVRIQYIENTVIDGPFRGDAYYYLTYANNLLKHKTFSQSTEEPIQPDSFRGPGYPAFLAAIIKLNGYKFKQYYTAVLYVQAFLGAVTAGITMLLGLQFLPFWGGFAAGVLVAGSPHLVSLGNYFLTETLFCFLMILFLYVFSISRERSRPLLMGVAGLIAGLCYLCNPVFFFAPFVLVSLFLLFSSRDRPDMRKPTTHALVFILAYLMFPGGWAIRNQLAVPEGSPTAYDRAFNSFIAGAHPEYWEMYWKNPRDPEIQAHIDIQQMSGSWRKFIPVLAQRILKAPLHYGKWYLIEKPLLYWDWEIAVSRDIYVYPVKTSLFQTSGPARGWYTIMGLLHYPLLILSAFGFFYLFILGIRPVTYIPWTLYGILIYVSIVYVVIVSEGRYSVPLRPEMYLSSIFGLWRLSKLV